MTADSTTEVEYIAASDAAKEAFWIKKFISGLGVVPSSVDPIPLLCDNNGTIARIKNHGLFNGLNIFSDATT